MVNIIRRQVVRLDVLDVTTGHAVPDDLSPFHAAFLA
jgi:hypothetical protein